MAKFGLIVLLFGITSCGIYRQNVVHTPLMEQKGQAQLGGHIGFNGLEGQAAYALTNKVAVLASYSDMGTRTKEYSSSNYETNKHNFAEIGAGLFKKTSPNRISEYYVLAGKGMTSRFVKGRNLAGLIDSTIQQVNYRRFVAQASFGNKNQKVQYILTPRLLAVNYYNIIDNSRRDFRDISNFHIYAEGAVTIRYPISKYLMLSGQFGITLPLSHSFKSDHYYEFSPINSSVGLIFNVDLQK